ncbi:uncharacterized protein K02A2.6-like [Uranotaenia lowii]|uniref:uncharacterized protein K02A2.6-like n=1 Tax=Uranotaenia lowii TaxID=190385 RepID=UPI00247857CD|nr:uncharacterized protein K02A2.6-like [Uranotaenia lowii]
MATTQEVFQTIMRQNQQMAEQNARLMQILERIGIQESSSSPKSSSPEFIIESLASNIREFIYDPENGLVFDRWYRKYEDLFLRDGAVLDDAAKVRLLRSLSVNVHEKNGHQTHKVCEDFELANLTADQFKSLIFICGLQSTKDADIRTRLLSKLEATGPEDENSLEILVKDAQRLQNLKLDTAMVEQHQQVTSVCTVKQRKFPVKPSGSHSKSIKTSTNPKTPCWQCGGMHFVRDCSYSSHACRDCKQTGHKDGYCDCFKPKPQSKAKVFKKRSQRFSSTQQQTSPSFRNINGATTASGKPLHLLGEAKAEVTLGDIKKTAIYYVTDNRLDLFGLEWIDLFELWDKPLSAICNQVQLESSNYIQRYKAKFPEVFKSTLGHCTKTKVRLYLNPNAQPVFKPKRPVPFNSVEKIDLELERLQKLNIITPVEFFQWAAPIVAVKKPGGRIRICADYSTGLNAALELNNYPHPVPDDIFSKLNGCRFFSIIDLSDAYLQSAPGAFQQLMNTMIAGLKGVDSFLDDILLYSRTEEEHRSILDGLFMRLQDYGFHLREEKCNLMQPQIRYLGHIVNASGLRPDPAKVEAIVKMPAPTDQQTHLKLESELVSFTNFQTVHSKLLLMRLDPSLKPRDSMGKSKKKDSLVFAVTKFHRMLLGRRFLLQTDHQPLLRIFGSKKGIPVHTANRLQRWALALLCYDFEIKYVSTSQFGYADVLSRLIDKHSKPDEEFVIASVQLEEDVEIPLQEAISSVPITFKMVTNATLKCPVLQQNCIMMSNRLVIPEFYHQRILKQLHRGHSGMERMKALARSHVYWPKIDDDISTFVRKCEMCAIHAKSSPKTPPQPWPATHSPWERIHIDFAGQFKGLNFLVVVDAHSRWPKICTIKSATSSAVIEFLDELFARFGIPSTIVSDNGTLFISKQFENFCGRNGIQHLRISPYHPQSNGQAERFVDSLKRSLLKINDWQNESLQTFLQVYRSTPSRVLNGSSPAELMIGRKIRTILNLLDHDQPTHSKADQGPRPHKLTTGAAVYAKLYRNNSSWKWVPGKILEVIGNVNFNILLEEHHGRRKLIRSHVDQVKLRYPGDAKPEEDDPQPPAGESTLVDVDVSMEDQNDSFVSLEDEPTPSSL